MLQGIIGKKLGMTQYYLEDGRVVPVTVIQAGPCVVVQKLEGTVQLGLVEGGKVKNINKPMKGHFEKAGVPPTKMLKEFAVSGEEIETGTTVKVDIFEANETVRIQGTTKGKGFQGVMKRWNFGGGRATHGSMFHRRPGSIGMCAFPGKVHKGKKMPGQTGSRNKTILGLRVVKVDVENNLLLVKGAVPGFNGNYVVITKEAFQG